MRKFIHFFRCLEDADPTALAIIQAFPKAENKLCCPKHVPYAMHTGLSDLMDLLSDYKDICASSITPDRS